jgi:hypothetical protein
MISALLTYNLCKYIFDTMIKTIKLILMGSFSIFIGSMYYLKNYYDNLTINEKVLIISICIFSVTLLVYFRINKNKID